jgi:hypothetical protein
MVMHIQPKEGITLNLSAKVPGPRMKLDRVAFDLRYSDWFDLPSSTGYETLLYDVMTSPYFNVQTLSKQAGPRCNLFWTSGGVGKVPFTNTRPAALALGQPMTCSNVIADIGSRWPD